MCSELVSCFLRFLKGLDECLNGPHYANAVLEPVDAEVADTYLADEPRLIDYLMSFCEKAKSSRTWTSEDSTVLACDTFSSILQASLHSRRFWTEFTSRKEAPKLIRRLVLEDMRSRLRCCTSEAISGFCKTTITSCVYRHNIKVFPADAIAEMAVPVLASLRFGSGACYQRYCR